MFFYTVIQKVCYFYKSCLKNFQKIKNIKNYIKHNFLFTEYYHWLIFNQKIK